MSGYAIFKEPFMPELLLSDMRKELQNYVPSPIIFLGAFLHPVFTFPTKIFLFFSLRR